MKKESRNEIIDVLELRKFCIIQFRKGIKNHNDRNCNNYEDCYTGTHETDSIDLLYYDSVIKNIKNNKYKRFNDLRKTIDNLGENLNILLKNSVKKDENGDILELDEELLIKTYTLADILGTLDYYKRKTQIRKETDSVLF